MNFFGEEDIPFALSRLVNGRRNRHYDSSGMEPGNGVHGDAGDNVEEDVFNIELEFDVNDNIGVNRSGINNVKDLGCDTMRERLVTHFNIFSPE